jgi:glutamyl-tRNA reductase
MEHIAENEIKKTFKSLPNLSAKEYDAISRMTEAIMNKFLHDPTLYLKNEGYHGDKSIGLDLTRKLFNLDQE